MLMKYFNNCRFKLIREDDNIKVVIGDTIKLSEDYLILSLQCLYKFN
jgi:hypothetical protein